MCLHDLVSHILAKSSIHVLLCDLVSCKISDSQQARSFSVLPTIKDNVEPV